MSDFNKNIKINIDVDSKSIEDLNKEVKDLNESLDDISLDPSQISKINNEINSISESLDAVKEASKDYSDALVESGVRVAQTFATTTGTILAFTSSEEDAAQVTANLAKATAVADSIEQIYNTTKAIGELRTKALALAEAKKTVSTVTGTVATEGATFAQQAYTVATNAATFATGLLGKALNALKTAGGWITILISGLISLGLYFAATYKSAQDLYDIQVKQNDLAKEYYENAKALREAESRDQASRITNDIDRTKKEYADKLKELKYFLDNVSIAEKALQKELSLARDTGNQENIIATQSRITELQVLIKDSTAEINEINRQSYEEDLDNRLNTFNKIKDIEIAKLSLLNTRKAREKVLELENEKVLEDINTRLLKGELTLQEANKERISARIDNTNKLTELTRALYNEELAKTNELRDLELERLSTVETKTARFAEVRINNLKAIDEINRQLFNDEITEEEAINKKLDQQETLRLSNLEIIKQINEETDTLNEETGKLNLDATINQLNKITDVTLLNSKEALKAIEQDTTDQLVAIGLLTDYELKAIEKSRTDSIALLGELAADAKEEQKKTFQDNIDAINKNAKIKSDIILENERQLTKDINEEAEKRNIEVITKEIEKLQSALTKLSEIKLFSDNAGINNFLNTIIGLEQGLNGALEVFKKFKQGVLTPEDVAAFASSLVDITNSIIQNAFQQNIDSFNKQLEVLAEKKAELEEDIQTSNDKIKELQGNLAQANIEDRNRIIKLIDIERKKEKQLQDQKRKAVEDELKLQEKVKEEKRKAFETQKAASVIQASIATALATVGALGSQPFTPFNLVLAGIVGALGAVQVGIIASQPVPEFKVGGFTENDSDNNKAVGVVHANEWVAPAWMNKSPKYKNTIMELENARVKGYASGGFVSDTSNDNSALLEKTIEALTAISERQVVVSVQEINSVSSKVRKTQVRSTL